MNSPEKSPFLGFEGIPGTVDGGSITHGNDIPKTSGEGDDLEEDVEVGSAQSVDGGVVVEDRDAEVDAGVIDVDAGDGEDIEVGSEEGGSRSRKRVKMPKTGTKRHFANKMYLQWGHNCY